MAKIDVFNLLKNRRSVKPELFDGGDIDENSLEIILEAANWAPSHALTEPWRLKLFRNEGLQSLGHFEAEYYKKNTPAEKFVSLQYEKAMTRPLNSSVVMAVNMHRVKTGKIIPLWEEIAAVACAVQNMWLTANDLGFQCYWGSGGSTNSEALKNWLGLAEEDLQMGFFYIGRYSGSLPHGKRVSPIQDKLLI